MDVKLWTGTGSNQTITTGFSPDLVWAKPRSAAASHGLYDTVRGNNLRLSSNQTAAEATVNLQMGSTGFTVEGSSSYGDSGVTYVAWTWDAGSSTVTNTDGSITSSVRANPSAGFSIVTYTASGTAGATVGHGLGVAPQFIIVKNRDYAQNWFAYHQYIGGAGGLNFNTTEAAFTSDAGYWNSTNTSSSVITLGNYHGAFGTHGYIAYCFAPVEGYSAFGSYTGNGSADGPFVYTGFRPRWIMVKSTSASGWIILDSARDSFNLSKKQLFPHSNTTEYDSSPDYFNVDILSNGFKLRSASGASNGNNVTYIYAAFAENPFALNARAR
jgi:hypothetical protein